MQRVLNQEEIDAIVQAARGQTSGGPKEEKSVQSCDFRQAGQLSRELAQAINGLYESFARNLSQSLGLYLPVAIQTLLVSRTSWCARRRSPISIGQDERSCAVYGMPRACAEQGTLRKVLPLDAIPLELVAVANALVSRSANKDAANLAARHHQLRKRPRPHDGN